MSDEDFKLFRTDLGEALKHFKKMDVSANHRVPAEFIGKTLDIPTGQFLHNYCDVKVEEVQEKGGAKVCKMLQDYAEDREILGAFAMAMDYTPTKKEAIEKTCSKYPITPEELESLIEQWEAVVESGRLGDSKTAGVWSRG